MKRFSQATLTAETRRRREIPEDLDTICIIRAIRTLQMDRPLRLSDSAVNKETSRTKRTAILAMGIALACFFLIATPAMAAGADARALADQGVQAFAGGRYAEAEKAWGQAWAGGLRNADLACNLGDAAFRQRRLGPAVLWYQRALWLDPGHDDARHNLEFARQFLADKVPPTPPSFLGSVWDWIVARVGVNAAGWLLLALFAGTCAAALSFLRLREGPHRFRAGVILAVMMGLTAAWGAVFAGLAWREDSSREAVVLEAAVDVRSGPSPGNPVLFTVHEGLTVEVAADARGWYQVVLPNGWNGWIPADSAGLVQQADR